MSEKTAPALAKLNELLPLLRELAPGELRDELIETAEALQRAVAAFHMEAIRFRMHTVDRLVSRIGTDEARRVFGEVRHALETAGFHTRSHAAP
jgi:hypothetical protein